MCASTYLRSACLVLVLLALSVSEARADAPGSSEAREYNAKVIRLTADFSGGIFGPRGALAFQGSTRLSPEMFYRVVGRDDLRKRYVRRRATRIGLMVGGVLVVAGGLAYIAGAPECYEDLVCERSRNRRVYYGLGLAALGGGASVFGVLLAPHPVSRAEAQGLANAYNADLRERLGGLGPREEPPAGLRVAPSVSPDLRGAGLSVSGRF